jgi:hypothetical protein
MRQRHGPSGLVGCGVPSLLAWVVACLLATACWPVWAVSEGRWEGQADLPGLGVPVVLDLLPLGTGWAGQITLPGRGRAAAALAGLRVQSGAMTAELAVAAGAPPESAARLELQRSPDGRSLAGRWLQGGHAAPLLLRRTGPAQTAPPLAAAPWPAALDGSWQGRYDIGFGPREVTLRLRQQTASMTVVGRRTTEVAFDSVRIVGAFLQLQAEAFDMRIEAPAAAAGEGRLAAMLRQGPFESALPLTRQPAP